MSEEQKSKRERPGDGELPIVPGKRFVEQSPNVTSQNREIDSGLAKYFQKVTEQLNHLQYGDPADYIRSNWGINSTPSPLDTVWIPPRFRHLDQASEDITLDHLLSDSSRCLLILADPGCGKSTLSRFLTLAFIKRYLAGVQDYFGLLVPFNHLSLAGLSNQEAIVICAAKFVGLENDTQVIESLSANLANSCVIFDGLDELPISRRIVSDVHQIPTRSEAASLVRSLYTFPLAQSKDVTPQLVIVTCRSKDYFEDRERSGSSYFGAIPQYFITKFSPDQMTIAVQRWHSAALKLVEENSEGLDNRQIVKTIKERQQEIKNILRENSDLATVCLTPIMLSVLLSVYAEAHDLPSSVSELCWRAVKWFLIEKHSQSSSRIIGKDKHEWLLRTLTDLGFYAHEEIEKSGRRSFETILIRKIAKSAYTSNGAKLDYAEFEDAITSIVMAILNEQSIIVKSSVDEYDFSHNIFREVLAGRSLQNKSMIDRAFYVSNEHWQGPIRYWAGTRAREVGGLYEISAFVAELLSSNEEKQSLNVVLSCAEMLAEVKSTIPNSELTRLMNSQVTSISHDIEGWLEEPTITLAQRVRIGDLLGILGDRRLDEITHPQKFIVISSGKYTIGRSSNHKLRIPKYQTCPASPEIMGELRTFSMSPYLITNQDYAKFILDNGYSRPEFWYSDVGRGWALGDKDIVGELLNNARNVAGTHFASELVGQRFTADEIPERVSLMIDRRLPMYWLDPAHNRPNQPVVGINWWEANAYCAWLEAKLKENGDLDSNLMIRLPIEAEWEVAARLCGNDNIYPWFDGVPATNAHVRAAALNSDESPIFRSCAVGLFRHVKSNLPLYDMVGNVWEWIGSKSGPYLPSVFEQSINYQGLDDRIARGSSWLSQEEESTEITFRSYDPPFNAYEDLGFRIVVAERT